jgi:hypothetical protein
VWQVAPFCAAALVLTVLAPLWLLLLSPILLGVPHVVADIRYLLLGQGSVRPWAVALLAPLGALTVLRLAVVLGAPSHPALEAGLGVASIVAALAFAEGPARRRAAAWLVTGGLAVLALTWPTRVVLGLGHAHNAIALGLWLAWAGASWWGTAAVAVLVCSCAGLIGAGVFDGLSAAAGAFAAPSTGLDFGSLARTLAPGFDGMASARIVLVYAFAQAMHYAVWLVLLPAAARRRTEPPRPWLAGLRDDLGAAGFVLAASLTLAVVVAGALAPVRTRETYLTLVLFHGWLELAVIARWLIRPGRPPWAR